MRATYHELEIEIKTIIGKINVAVQYRIFDNGDVILYKMLHDGKDYYPLISDNQERQVVQKIKKFHKIY